MTQAEDQVGHSDVAPLRHKGILIFAVMGATIMQILDTTIANVALPHMQTGLGATMESVTWVLTSYMVASAIITPVTGWLAERLGVRNLFLFSVAGFVAASVLCGAAVSIEEMVLFRILQGLSGALLAPLSQTIMFEIYPPDKSSKAMSIWGMGVMIGPILGPIIGALLTEHLNWRWVFLVNLPVGIIAFILLFWLLPRRPTSRRKLDFVGYGSLALGVAALQMLLDRGHQLDWYESGEIWIETGLMITGFWVFAVQMVTSSNPLFAREIFRDKSLMLGLMFMIVIGIVMFSSMALLPPMLQGLFGYPVLDTGILLGTRGVGVLISMAISGRLMNRGVDMRIIVAVGLLIGSVSAWMMTGWSLDITNYHIALSGMVQGLGIGLVFIPLNSLAFATLPARYRTDGASLLNLVRSLGASIGISIMTVMLARNWQIVHSELGASVTSSTVNAVDASTLDRFQGLGDTIVSMADVLINRQALMVAYLNDFYLLMWITLLAIPMVLLLDRPKPGGGAPPMGE